MAPPAREVIGPIAKVDPAGAQLVDPQDPVKLSRLVLRNRGDAPARFRLYAYVEWVMGVNRTRTSATTVLATSLLRHAAYTSGLRDTLLTFTDNRQGASFQGGHFNDSVQLGVLRSALYAAPCQREELTAADVAAAVVRACQLELAHVARNPELDPASSAANEVWDAFSELTEYQLCEDLRRGWRVVQPNLEQVGLLRLDYRGLAALCADDHRWRFHPAFAHQPPEERHQLTHQALPLGLGEIQGQ